MKFEKETSLENSCNSQIKCPYCGHEETDSWEFSDDSGEWNCENCDKTMHVERIVSVDYTTYGVKK